MDLLETTGLDIRLAGQHMVVRMTSISFKIFFPSPLMILLVWSWLEDERQGSTILTMKMRKFDEYAKHKARRLDTLLILFSLVEDGRRAPLA